MCIQEFNVRENEDSSKSLIWFQLESLSNLLKLRLMSTLFSASVSANVALFRLGHIPDTFDR